MADKCPVCKFPIERHEQPGYIGEPFCSEFCATTSAEEKLKFTDKEVFEVFIKLFEIGSEEKAA
jgi:hypothetical protein